MYGDNNGADRIGTVDTLGLWSFHEEINQYFNGPIHSETEPETEPVNDSVNGDDSFISLTIETIQYFLGEFTKLFHAYSGIE